MSFESLISATRPREVERAVEVLTAGRPTRWRLVGDNENNLATINLGSDPAAGLVERITNAIDAVLEREWLEHGRPVDVASPRAAVERWFGLGGGRLSRLADLDDSAIEELAGRVCVTLRDSGRRKEPTADVRDYGVGIAAEEFPTSILSLQRDRKLRKLHLAGEFGQGGSTALSYSAYTVIVSRPRVADGAGPKPVAATVVRFNPGDPNVDKHGVYEYLVDAASGAALTLDVPEDAFSPGTLVRHVAMDLGKYRNAVAAPTGSLWYLANHYLFDPVLPFTIEERRKASRRDVTWTVTGNHRRLSREAEIEYRRSADLKFRRGRVMVTWWVLTSEGEDARNRIARYTLASRPIVITYNGQKQGEFPHTIIKNDLRLPYLERYIIVHVDCDRLDSESRRQLFPTTRESLRDTSLMEALRELITETLRGDDELARLDRERKRRFIRRLDSESVENIRRRLARRVRSTTRAGGRGRSSRVSPPESEAELAKRAPIPLREPPTLLEITSPTPRKVYAGRRFSLRFRTDAAPSYFRDPGTFRVMIEPSAFAGYIGTTNVRDGHGIAYFLAAEDLVVGDQAEITLELRVPGVASLGAAVDAVVIPYPEDVGTENGRVRTPNINPQWVVRGDAFWVEQGWDEWSVAAVERSEESVEVYVSADNKRLNALLARAQRRNVATVDALKDFYLEHIAFHALLADLDRELAEPDRQGAVTAIDFETWERSHEYELRRACETVCGIMEQAFEFFAARASSTV